MTAAWTERQMRELTAIRTRGGPSAEGGWPLYPPGCWGRPEITPCYRTGRGHFPGRGRARLEKAVKLEQSARRSQDSLNFRRSRDSSVRVFSYPLCEGEGEGSGELEAPRPLLACTAAGVAKSPGSLWA